MSARQQGQQARNSQFSPGFFHAKHASAITEQPYFCEGPNMLVEMRPISSIRPYENNPRLNDAAVDAVAASIKEFGFRQPIVVDEAGVIIVGHTRYKAA